MSEARRAVRATTSFFDDLDRQIPSERGPPVNPQPMTSRSSKLIRIVDRFATGLDDLPELIPGRSDYRILISAEMIVALFAVVGQVAHYGAVELVQLDIYLEAEH